MIYVTCYVLHAPGFFEARSESAHNSLDCSCHHNLAVLLFRYFQIRTTFAKELNIEYKIESTNRHEWVLAFSAT